MTPETQTGGAAAAALLREIAGRSAEGTWSAPGRVNLIGEHTDYNDGYVLPFAIDRRTHVALARRDDGIVRVASTFAADPVEVPLARLDDVFPAERRPDWIPEWAAYPLGVAWAMLRDPAGSAIEDPTGVDLAVASDVPVGAGLSSSAAIEGATAVALADVWGGRIGAMELARIGRRAENDAVGAPTGIMDQVAALMGRADAAVFLDCRSLDVQVVPLALAAEGLEILVIDTKVSHAHATGGYRARRESCERGAAAMGVAALRDLTPGDLDRARDVLDDETFRRVRHIVTENQRVLDTVEVLRAEGPAGIGDLLAASHASMRDDFEISVPELDVAVETATAHGAIGARMTGGGFGGAAIAVVPTAARAAIEDAVSSAFATCGFAVPSMFTVEPSSGAGRDS